MRAIASARVSSEPTKATTVFGLAAYNGAEHLAEALESLLGQTRGDLAIVVVDDCSTDETGEIALRYADLDPRVTYERNERRLGLARNWRRAFDLARQRVPEAEYFAWASDHDVWYPRWLETLAAELDDHPEAVLAYPLVVRIDEQGAEYPSGAHRFDTAGLDAPVQRVRRTTREMAAAGAIIYGLARRAALERCGPFPVVVLPDRLHLIRLSVEGEFRQVQRPLWNRRYRAGVTMSNRRQRRTSFPGRPPLWTYLPWWLTHAGLLGRSLEGDPSRVRLGGLAFAGSVRYAWERRRNRVRRERRWRRKERRLRHRRMVRAALRRLGLDESIRAVAPRQVDARAGEATAGAGVGDDREGEVLSRALSVLDRAGLLDDLAVPGAVVLEIDGGTVGVGEQLTARFPELVSLVVSSQELGSTPIERIDLAVSIGSLEHQAGDELALSARRLHELGAQALYCFERESLDLLPTLGRWYWLREVWVESDWNRDGRVARKPDPTTGPVPRAAGRHLHLVGRRRLLPERDPKLG